ncbi:MAG: hypothetical protein Q7R85_01895 [bacterium]|nr:hypothetical protein [bacterium]
MSYAARIKFFFQRHWIALLFAVVVGGLAVAPQLLAIRALGADYKGAHLLTLDDNSFYVARMHEILDGHGWVSSPFIYEYKNAPPFLYPIGEYAYMWPVFFGASFVSALIFAKFFFPAVLFFLIYILLYRLTDAEPEYARKLASVAGGLLATTGYGLVDYNSLLPVLNGKAQFFAWSLWARPVNPVTGAILLFTFLLLLWQLMRRPSVGVVVAAGAVFALMFGYFFTWGMALSVAGVLGAIAFVLRDYTFLKRLALAVAVGFMLAAPYWYNMRAVAAIPEADRIYAQNGLLLTHAPIANKVLFLALLIFISCLIAAYRKSKREGVALPHRWWFCSALILGGLWALNQQIITGKTIWPYHFVQYTTPLAVVAVMAALAFVFRPRLPRLWAAGMLGVSAFALFYGVMAARTYAYQIPEFRSIQTYDGVLSWLRANAPDDCVVLSAEGVEEKLTRLIPAFTQCNDYANGWMQASYNAEARVLHNILTLMRVNGVTSRTVRAFLIEHRTWIRDHFRRDWRDLVFFDERWIDGLLRAREQDFTEFMNEDFLEALRRYRVDYVASDGPLKDWVYESLHRPLLIGDFDNDIYLYQL